MLIHAFFQPWLALPITFLWSHFQALFIASLPILWLNCFAASCNVLLSLVSPTRSYKISVDLHLAYWSAFIMDEQSFNQRSLNPPSPIPSSGTTSFKTNWFCLFGLFFINIVTLPYRRALKLYTWEPLRRVRAAQHDPKVLVYLLRDFKVDKYHELQSVQVAVSISVLWNQ